ncbi:L-seryl-tRNA(Sec) selenium transferase [Helicobacter sp. MIT 05-5294]|uniref:L-seryl-tRNA(Sec) selenium transferase n=1 Tax=Helicobacter sp. MIT 05-5294 TaxID=1548150 RepID=UPI0010FE1F72|nr:L-seryl-tRNA(Sec) selenium transferase [Helicobacter sp. MIT 05-5294]TLD87272.1 L-seryl-tRNA(Sec) selenium transferase [Helicobacter sp. MIT 05-5294]
MQNILRHIPKADKLLNSLKSEISSGLNLALAKRLIAEFLEGYRQDLLQGGEILDLATCAQTIAKEYYKITQKSLKPLVNATGIVVHTNLGRSVFSPAILQEILPLLTRYNNLEYNQEKGNRSERYVHLKGLFKALLGAEDVLVVNNNAAAVFLIFNTFAKGKEVVVSRGELIEIGGSFRIPRVMEDSGAILREVGTTNKTHLKDYQEALNENTAMLFKAHKSNYAMSGFVKEVEFGEIVELAKARNLVDYYDLGSGYFGLSGFENILQKFEPALEEITRLNPSLVSFSGDKLLGGAQAGIIFGKKALIDKLKKNQLLRMLRVDKFTIAALEATLNAYLTGKTDKIPTCQMLLKTKEELRNEAQSLAAQIPPLFVPEVVATKSYSGGGAMPSHYLESFGVALEAKNLAHFGLNEQRLEEYLRGFDIIARLENGALILDMRTLLEGDMQRIVEAFVALEQSKIK